MKQKILILITIFNYSCIHSISPKLLKGTHNIQGVPADFSPVMGLSFLEWDIAEQWYKLSSAIQAKQLAEVLKNNPTAEATYPGLSNLIDSKDATNTERLIISMFHIAGGTFNITNADGNPVKYVTPKDIGKILKVVYKWNDALQNPDKLNEAKNDALAKTRAVKEKIKTLDAENKQLNSQISKAQLSGKSSDEKISSAAKQNLTQLKTALSLKQKEIERYQNLIKKQIDPTSKDFVASGLRHELSNLCMGFGYKNGSNLFQEKDWKSFLDSLVGSIKESMGVDASYAKNTAEGILLGYMLQKSNTRKDLQDYFKGFTGDDHFVLAQNVEYDSEEISSILATKTDATDAVQMGDLLSAYTYKALYAFSFPKIVSHKEVTYKGISFKDCMDNAVRMMANIVTYKLPGSKLGVAPEGVTLNPVVEKFYASEDGLCANAAEVNNSKVHQAWTNVAENLSGCSYNQIGDGQGNNFDGEVSNFCDGVMPVDTAPEGLPTHELRIVSKVYHLPIKKVGERTYWLVPKSFDLVCAEMMPNASNIIVAMNNIFNLNLFSDNTIIFDSKFASTYFEKMCEKLNWQPQISLEALDAKNSSYIPIKTQAGVFYIHLYDKAHGYISIESKAKLNIDLIITSNTDQAIVAAIIGMGIYQLPEKLQVPSLYKYVSVLNTDKRYEFIEKIFRNNIILPATEKKYIQSLITSFAFVGDQSYLRGMVRNFGAEIKIAGLGDIFVNTLHLHDVSYQNSFLFLECSPRLIKNKLTRVEQIFPNLGKWMTDSFLDEFQTRITITDLLSDKLITIEQLLPYIKKWIRSLILWA